MNEGKASVAAGTVAAGGSHRVPAACFINLSAFSARDVSIELAETVIKFQFSERSIVSNLLPDALQLVLLSSSLATYLGVGSKAGLR